MVTENIGARGERGGGCDEWGSGAISLRAHRGEVVEDIFLALLRDLLIEKADDDVAARPQRADLTLTEYPRHFQIESRPVEITHGREQAALAYAELFRVLEVDADPERSRMVDHPQLPIFGDHQVS